MFKPNPLKALWLASLGFILANASASLLSAQSVDVNAAKKEGKVVVYGTVVP